MIVWEDQFCDMLDNIVSLNKEYLLLGDFNIDLMFPRHRWTSILSSFNLQQLIKYPTRVTVNSCTLLDHIYVDINCSFKEICVVQCGLSDHFPICITLGFDKVKSSPKTHHEIRFRNFNNFDFNAFIADNDFKSFENMLGISDPDSALQLWVQIFTSIFNKHTPYCTKRVKTQQHNHWFTSEIKLELRQRWLLKHGSRVEYKKQRNNVKNLIRKAKKTYFETIINNKVSQKSIWTAINEITGKKKHVRTNPSISLTANDFSSAFACTNSFSNIISDDDLFKASHLTQAFCQEKLLGGHVKFDVPLMTMDDLITYFRILKPKKSCSFDEISMFMLQLAMPRIVSSLVYIYNLCISKCYFPSIFKKALIIPVHKKGDINNCANYRPISLLSSLCKPLEKHISRHMNIHFARHNLFHTNKSGFRSQHSCQTALIRANEYWLNSINSNKINGSLFIDFKQAFDTINHTILAKKLSYYGLSDSCVQILSSYLTARGQCVSFNKSISPLTNIKCGVPQGSVLGPLLFSIYINDLPLSVLHGTCDMFADDTCIHVSDACYGNVLSTLQLSADEVFNWATNNFMTIHSQKTKYMIITTWQKHQRIPLSNVSITINKQLIERVSHIKYLGVIVDNNLSWAYHIKEITSKIAKSTYQLARIKHFIDERCRKTFYHAYIHNKLEYGILLFGGAAAHQLRPLKSLQKRALKLVVKISCTNVFKAACVLPFQSLTDFQRSLLIMKSINDKVPQYIKSLFTLCPNGNNRFRLPLPRLDI